MTSECSCGRPDYCQAALHLPDERDSLKMIRETLTLAQQAMDRSPVYGDAHHSLRLSRLIEEIDRQRPLGSNGKHGHLHTPTCGCEDAPSRTLTPDELAEAQRIREVVGPMRGENGRIDARAVAQESTLRGQAGLPGWIAALDAPGRVAIRHTDAGRFPAPREEAVMAEGTAEKRESWDHASNRGSTIAQFATMDPSDAVRELESRSVAELRELARDASMSEGWHLQGAADARVVRERIGQVLRSAGQDADPEYGQAAAESIRR